MTAVLEYIGINNHYLVSICNFCKLFTILLDAVSGYVISYNEKEA